MKPSIEFDQGKIVLWADGPWHELTPYEVAALIRSGCAALQAEIKWREYPPIIKAE